MQRWLPVLGRRLLSSSSAARQLRSPLPRVPAPFPGTSLTLAHISQSPLPLGFRFQPPFPLLPMVQARHFAVKDRSRAPATPITSKVKKYKLKSYSSFKFRFRTMNDGNIRRWRAGKRHNAHLKSKKAKRRLRKPEIVHAAYAKVMKKLNFCG
ncbi:putative ribosomal protein L35 [Dioscorea sansibarensis]